jgi:hypothetical protein
VCANKEESDFILFLSAFPSLRFRLFARSSKKAYLYHFLHTIMDSKIQTIAPYYSKFENILSYELIHSEITELGRARIGAFKANLKNYGDQILEELQKDGLILIK